MQNLLSQFPIANNQAVNIVRKYAGAKLDAPFHEASPELNGNMRGLVQDLTRYDDQPNRANARAVKSRMDSLRLVGLRLREDPDSLFIYPAPNSEVAVVAGACILWRPGKVRVPGVASTYDNPWFSTCLSLEHVNRDFIERAALTFWLTCKCKVMLCNARMPGMSPPPPGQQSPCQASRNIADVAHSNVTGYARVFHELVRIQFPSMAVVNLHGFGAKGTPINLIALNNYNSQFLDTGAKSWPLLCMLAAAQFDFEPNSMVFATTLPGFFVNINGRRMPLIEDYAPNPNHPPAAYFRSRSGVQNSNVPAHIRNNGSCVLGREQLDMSMHMELARSLNAVDSPVVPNMARMLLLAQNYYLRYDITKHNPYALPDQIRNNMRLYRDYFFDSLNKKATLPAMRMSLAAVRPDLALRKAESLRILDVASEPGTDSETEDDLAPTTAVAPSAAAAAAEPPASPRKRARMG